VIVTILHIRYLVGHQPPFRGRHFRFCLLRKPLGSSPNRKFEFHCGKWWLGEYPSPPVYWNHPVRGEILNNLWGSIAYGQNIEPQGLRSGRPILAYTAFALARICFVDCGAQGRRSHGAMISVTSRLSKKMGSVWSPSFHPQVLRARSSDGWVLTVRRTFPHRAGNRRTCGESLHAIPYRARLLVRVVSIRPENHQRG